MSTYAVIDPSTGIEVQAYPTATDADVEAAVAAAAEVFATWSRQTSVAERAQLVRRVGELHTERREQLADIIGREMGKADAALGEVDFCREIHDYYADHAEALLADEAGRAPGLGHRRRPAQCVRRAAGDHALELPVLPGRPVRGTQPRHGQPDHPQARPAVPGVGRGPAGDLPRRGFPRGRVREPLRHQRPGGDHHR